MSTDPNDLFGQDRPNVARVYDYVLGGFSNFEPDRQAGDQLLKVDPTLRVRAIANRNYLRRVVTELCRAGIDQFLDIGSGLPSVGNVHEIALQHNPKARTVYIDNDRVAVLYSRHLLDRQGVQDNVIALEGDVREPEAIISDRDVTTLLDLSRPIAVLFFTVFHFVIDDAQAAGIMRFWAKRLPSGSYVAISHGTFENAPQDVIDKVAPLYKRSVTEIHLRTRAELTRFFDGLDLLEPGVVYIPEWRPEDEDDLFINEPEQTLQIGGVARKR